MTDLGQCTVEHLPVGAIRLARQLFTLLQNGREDALQGVHEALLCFLSWLRVYVRLVIDLSVTQDRQRGHSAAH